MKALRAATLLVLVCFALYGLVVVGQFIGYATHQGQGGNIYEIVLRHGIPTDQWAGLYGVAVRVDGYFNQQAQSLSAQDIEGENLLFDCLEPNIAHEIYASTSSGLDLTTIQAASAAEVASFYGLNNTGLDSPVNTFTQNITFEIGSTSITAPGTYTYKLDESGTPQTFATVAVKDGSGDIGFAILITSNFTEGYNGDIINYQALLPVFRNGTPALYYFFTDPNDVCPQGVGEAPNTAEVIGNVTNQGGQRIEEVIVEIAGVVNITNADGFYRLEAPIGTHKIYAIKEGYKVYYNNVTVVLNETTVHNIVLIEDVVNPLTGVGPGQDAAGDKTQDDVGPDVGPGQSDGVDVGPGEAPPVPFVEEPKEIEGKDYIVSLSEIRRKVRLDNFYQESMFIYSFKKNDVTVTFTLEGENISNVITLDKTQVIVGPDSNEQVVITIWGRPPVGTYSGNLTLSGEINATIPLDIEVLPREKLPVEALLMNLETNKKSLLPGQEFKLKTDLRNLLIERSYPVKLFFTVQPVEGNETVWSFSTNIYLKTAFSLIRSIELPQDLAPGDYVVRASASYLGLSSSTDTIFTVDVPFWSKTTFGLKNWIWLIILFVLLSGAVAGYLIYRNAQGKKKYHLKVEYDELPKPGPRNVYVGKIAETEHKTYFNLENFKVHTIVAGSTGGGKSVSAQVIVEEALDHEVAIIVFDPTAQWTGMLRACKDKTMLSLYPFFGMKKTDAKAYNGNIRMITNPRELIDIKKYAKPGEIQIFAGHKLDPKDMDTVVANAIREIFHANFGESKPLKILFVFDEVHRLLPKFGGSGDGFLQIERGCREFRKWGLGIILVSQVLSDFMGTIKANINTEIQMRTRDEGDLERIRQKYGEEVLRSLVKATVGSGMVENPAYNRGKPYFVAFRPLKHSVERLSDEEIEQYNKYNDLVDELEYSLEQLEQEKVDVFDLKLELKLALDKVKQGNFNMVQIYLDGLRPRIDKQWEKLGKQPKKFERKIVDEAALKADLAKAQEEREEYEKASAAKEGEKKEEKKEWGWKDDVDPKKMLNLKNDMIVLNLASLYDEVSAMKDKHWEAEVNDAGNRLADWVEDATGLTNLANNLRATKDKEESLKLLVMVRDGKPLPEVKAPEKPTAAPEGQAPAQEGGSADAAQAVAPDGEGANATARAAEEEKPQETKAPAVDAQALPQETAAGVPSTEIAKEPETPSVEPSSSRPETPAQPAAAPASPPPPIEAAKPVPAPAVPEIPAAPQILSRAQPSIDDLVAQDPDQYFKLENGMTLKSAKDLADYLPKMDESIFSHHVGEGYNHFADWVRNVFHDERLANDLAQAHTREQMLAVMR